MGYVGNQQTEGYSQVPAKQDLTGATGTSLTLTHAVASAEGIDLFINNVRQEPTTAYSVGADGVTVTLTGSVVATDDIYVVYNSLARQTSTHPSNQHLNALSGTFTQDLTVDTNTLYVDSTNNRVGVGTVSPSQALHVVGEGLFEKASADSVVSVTSTGGSGRSYQIRSQTSGDFYVYDNTAGTPRLAINSSGNVLFQNNISSSGSYGSYFSPQSSDRDALFMKTSTTAQIGHIHFYNPNGLVGYIATNGSSTNYIVSSDYRLKTNVNYDWDATSRLKQLKPARFEWIADGDDAVPVDGFLAHEVQDIVPEAISGTKDAVDDEGNPVYQGIDQSKLVPLLVKTIQELEARIAALEAN